MIFSNHRYLNGYVVHNQILFKYDIFYICLNFVSNLFNFTQVDELLDGRDSDEIKWSDLQKMPYLTCCIKESLRMYSPVPFTSRMLEEDLEIDGKVHKFCVLALQFWP